MSEGLMVESICLRAPVHLPFLVLQGPTASLHEFQLQRDDITHLNEACLYLDNRERQ